MPDTRGRWWGENELSMAKKKQIQADTLPLVAIDLGSDSIRAMAAKSVGDDMLQILGVEELRRNCVEQGVVKQSSDAGFAISRVLQLLANRIGVEELPTAFVSVGGKKLTIVDVRHAHDQVRKREVTQAILDKMEAECRQKLEDHNPEVCVPALIPVYYKLDGVEVDTLPLEGRRAAMIEGFYTAFAGTKEMAVLLDKAFNQAGRSIEASFVRPEALFSAFSTADGARILTDGCAILDMGAQTTTLTIYKAPEYLYCRVIPQGGYHITRTIEDQGIAFDMAERLKKKCGYASADLIEQSFKVHVPASEEIGGQLTMTGEDLAFQINLKLDEILMELMKALKPYEARLKRLYVTGGASMLKGIIPYLQQKTNLEVLYGSHAGILAGKVEESYYEPRYSALVGTLLLGADYRAAHPGEEVKKPTFKQRVEDTLVSMFDAAE